MAKKMREVEQWDESLDGRKTTIVRAFDGKAPASIEVLLSATAMAYADVLKEAKTVKRVLAKSDSHKSLTEADCQAMEGLSDLFTRVDDLHKAISRELRFFGSEAKKEAKKLPDDVLRTGTGGNLHVTCGFCKHPGYAAGDDRVYGWLLLSRAGWTVGRAMGRNFAKCPNCSCAP